LAPKLCRRCGVSGSRAGVMNLLADESIDAPIVEALRSVGHQVLYVTEMSPGITDEAVL
jgi:hypothetical protein